MAGPRVFRVLFVSAMLALAGPARATWSIVVGDEATGELAIGTATCLVDQDLLAIVPVVVVGRGVGAVQAFADFSGERRPIIFEGLRDGLSPEEILDLLEKIPGHEFRQYGIVDTQGRAITQTGNFTDEWTGGVTGSFGSTWYAIQGNSLAGDCVVTAIETALIETPGDLPTRLMAAMQAATEAGGDGRCSCAKFDPTACGCPPPGFDKAAHIGGMIVSRIGDADDAACDVEGCADGDYFLRFNVAFQNSGDADPVAQMEGMFQAWRKDLEGRPDAIRSSVVFDPPFITPNGISTTTMTIFLRDWRGVNVTTSSISIFPAHAEGSDGLSQIGDVRRIDHATYAVELTAGRSSGVDRFRITVDDGMRPVVLMPPPSLRYFQVGDLNGDGMVGVADLLEILASWGLCPEPPGRCEADLDGNRSVDIGDLLALILHWG